MSRRPFLLKLLNVRASEWKVVSQLFWLQFFMGTGIAFFFTASFSHFLEKFSASQLAWVMIISSPLLFLTGWVFNKFEHRFHLTRVGTIVIILMAVSILAFQLSSNWIKGDWFYYLTFAWYYVLYLASNLCFWSITSTLFDVRQSKRLFAVISGGDIPAKFIGYTMAYFFVKAIGPLNLLWPAFAFMLGALPFLYQLSKSGVVHHHHHHADHVEFIQGKGFKVFVKRYTLNTLIRRLAVLTFIISACLAIINYAFYSEVKEQNHGDKALSNFIILFMAASQIIALLVKIILTGRIVTSIGIKKSLLITPLVLLGLLIIIIAAQFVASESSLVFYAFGIAAIAVEVLRTTITNPVFLTVMQPLNPNARSKAHAIVKGIMDPFAFLFAGVLLIIINNLKPGNELLILCYILAFFGISWIVSILLVNRSYHHTLLKAISSRFFSQDEFKLSDEELQQQILKKIKTGNETEIINILQMLNSQISVRSKEIIFKLLDHPSDNIKKVTLLLIQTRNIKGAEEKLKVLADHDKNKEIQILAVQSLCKEQNEHHHLKHYLHHHDAGIKAAALMGMLKSNDKENRQYAEDIVTELIQSAHIKDKQTALQVLTEVKDLYCHPHLTNLFTDDRGLRLTAFKAIGESATPLLMERVMTYFKEHPLHVGASLHAAGEKSIPFILKKISNNDTNSFLKEKLIIVLGKIGGLKAQATLFELLEKYPSYAGAIAKSLNRSRYSATEETQEKLEGISLAYIIYGTELLYMQSLLEHDENCALINSSLNIELIEIRNILICLFGCLYDHEKAFKIKQGLDMKKKESVANAMELIDMIVKKELAIPFNKLYEPADIEYRSNSLKNFLPPDKVSQTQEILSKILEEKPIAYNIWTKACSMYISKKTSAAITPGLIEKFIHSENILLKETALYAQ
ncbi:MAG TPA: MFS transporter [Chitinophagaceae bacterium]